MSVTINELKDHLRIIENDENSILQTYLYAAIEHIGSQTGRYLNRESRVAYFDDFSDDLELCGDSPQITSVQYIDVDGVQQTLDSSIYELKTHKAVPYITLAYNQSWPSVRDVDAAIEVNYTSGYNAGSLPDRLKAAVLLEAATQYEFRENETMAKNYNRMAVERLIAPMVIYKT